MYNSSSSRPRCTASLIVLTPNASSAGLIAHNNNKRTQARVDSSPPRLASSNRVVDMRTVVAVVVVVNSREFRASAVAQTIDRLEIMQMRNHHLLGSVRWRLAPALRANVVVGRGVFCASTMLLWMMTMVRRCWPASASNQTMHSSGVIIRHPNIQLLRSKPITLSVLVTNTFGFVVKPSCCGYSNHTRIQLSAIDVVRKTRLRILSTGCTNPQWRQSNWPHRIAGMPDWRRCFQSWTTGTTHASMGNHMFCCVVCVSSDIVAQNADDWVLWIIHCARSGAVLGGLQFYDQLSTPTTYSKADNV